MIVILSFLSANDTAALFQLVNVLHPLKLKSITPKFRLSHTNCVKHTYPLDITHPSH
jgi:hypothetical protein